MATRTKKTTPPTDGTPVVETVNAAPRAKKAPASTKKAPTSPKKATSTRARTPKPAPNDNSRAVAAVPSREVSTIASREVSTTVRANAKSRKIRAKKQPDLPPVVITPTKKKVLFATSEALPFAGTGGLGEVMGSLPKAIAGEEFDVRVIMPLYESVMTSTRERMEFVGHINVPLAWRSQYCGVFRLVEDGVTYYFVDNEYYFKRPNLYGYYDDGERFAYFSRAVVEVLPLIDFCPDIIASQDWQTALVPIYYKLYYMYRPFYEGIRTVFTIHNVEYQGKYSRVILEDVFGISDHEYGSLEHNGCINLMRGALDYADYITTVSPTYAQELLQPFYAHGLQDVMQKNHHKLRGILNGIDNQTYDPATNTSLFCNFSAEKIADKAVNKHELRAMLGFDQNDSVPLIGIVTRLVSHKGLDLVRMALDEILRLGTQIVILGKGDPDYESYFAHQTHVYNTRMAAIIAYNKDLSHKIFSGADIFLMPSKSEPCGLSQMMACRYGTIPVVRATGGLRDSIVDCGDGDHGNGFVFDDYNVESMMVAVRRAVGLYRDYRDKWDGLVQRAMASDFGWQHSADQYRNFFVEILQ